MDAVGRRSQRLWGCGLCDVLSACAHLFLWPCVAMERVWDGRTV